MTDAITAERAVPEPLLSASAVFDNAADGGAIGAARAFTADFLAAAPAVRQEPVTQERVDLAKLVVSELVTNAHKYAPGPCLLDLEIRDGAVEVSVWDTDPTLPVAQSPDPGRVGQHGLEIVIGACRSFEMRREPVGKRITAAIALADDPGGDPAGRVI